LAALAFNNSAASYVLASGSGGTLHLNGGTASVYYFLPQPREELLSLLLTNAARGFIECMVGHFDNLAKLTNVLDQLFQTGKPKARNRR
jgi:hypothetical protein